MASGSGGIEQTTKTKNEDLNNILWQYYPPEEVIEQREQQQVYQILFPPPPEFATEEDPPAGSVLTNPTNTDSTQQQPTTMIVGLTNHHDNSIIAQNQIFPSTSSQHSYIVSSNSLPLCVGDSTLNDTNVIDQFGNSSVLAQYIGTMEEGGHHHHDTTATTPKFANSDGSLQPEKRYRFGSPSLLDLSVSEHLDSVTNFWEMSESSSLPASSTSEDQMYSMISTKLLANGKTGQIDQNGGNSSQEEEEDSNNSKSDITYNNNGSRGGRKVQRRSGSVFAKKSTPGSTSNADGETEDDVPDELLQFRRRRLVNKVLQSEKNQLKLKKNPNSKKCEICGNYYSNPSTLVRHQVILHDLRPVNYKQVLLGYARETAKVKCTYCQKFVSKKSLRAHEKSVHGIIKGNYNSSSSPPTTLRLTKSKSAKRLLKRLKRNFKINNNALADACNDFTKSKFHPLVLIENIRIQPITNYQNQTNPQKNYGEPILTGMENISADDDDDGPSSTRSEFDGKKKMYFECPYCKKKLTTKYNLHAHQVNIHNDRNVPNFQKYLFWKTLKKTLPTATCTICNSTLRDRYKLQTHYKKIHHLDMPRLKKGTVGSSPKKNSSPTKQEEMPILTPAVFPRPTTSSDVLVAEKFKPRALKTYSKWPKVSYHQQQDQEISLRMSEGHPSSHNSKAKEINGRMSFIDNLMSSSSSSSEAETESSVEEEEDSKPLMNVQRVEKTEVGKKLNRRPKVTKQAVWITSHKRSRKKKQKHIGLKMSRAIPARSTETFCSICNKNMSSNWNLMQHQILVHNNTNVDGYETIMRSVKRFRPKKYYQLVKIRPVGQAIRGHGVLQSIDRSLLKTCMVCSRLRSKPRKLLQHQIRIHKERLTLVQNNKMQSGPNPESRQNTNSVKEARIDRSLIKNCRVCSRFRSKPQQLLEHQKRMHTNRFMIQKNKTQCLNKDAIPTNVTDEAETSVNAAKSVCTGDRRQENCEKLHIAAGNSTNGTSNDVSQISQSTLTSTIGLPPETSIMQTFPRLREVGPVRNLKKAKLKREEWLKRKVRADQLLKKVFSRLLTERCEVQLVDIGFITSGIMQENTGKSTVKLQDYLSTVQKIKEIRLKHKALTDSPNSLLAREHEQDSKEEEEHSLTLTQNSSSESYQDEDDEPATNSVDDRMPETAGESSFEEAGNMSLVVEEPRINTNIVKEYQLNSSSPSLVERVEPSVDELNGRFSAEIFHQAFDSDEQRELLDKMDLTDVEFESDDDDEDNFDEEGLIPLNVRKLHVVIEDIGFTLTKCPICKENVKLNKLEKHKMSHLIQCHICGKEVPLQHVGHHGTTHIANTRQCEICTFKSASRLRLWEHMNIHFGVKPVICLDCGFSTTSFYSLRSHIINKHTNIIRYSCSTCHRKFKQLFSLHQHKFSHYGNTCPICHMKATTVMALKAHMKIKHSSLKSKRRNSVSSD